MSGGKAKLKYTLSGVACPAQISGTASRSGSVNGKATVKVAAGKTTVIDDPRQGEEWDGAVQDRPEDERPPDDAGRGGQRDREVAGGTRRAPGLRLQSDTCSSAGTDEQVSD